MPLGLGLGLGLQKPTPPPVSAWPTIADIQQGVPVLDTDGVVKRKIGDYLVDIQYNVIGSGPLASAPAASASNQNLYYLSTDFGLCKYVSVFNNAGSDWIDCGFPSWLSQLKPTDNYFIDVIALRFATTAGYLFASTRDPATENLMDLYISEALGFFGGVGADATGVSPFLTMPSDIFKRVTLSNSVAGSFVSVDGSRASINKGTYNTPQRLFIGGRTDGATTNYEGRIACFRVRNGSGAVIDTLDLNKWDGTGAVRFDSGHVCTVTDGTPFTAKSYSLIPMSVLKCP